MKTTGEAAHTLPPLHVVTDDEVLARPGIEDMAMRVLDAGEARVALHVRGPATDAARLYRLAVRLAGAAEAAGALLVMNDRVDVALVAELRAVHLRGRSLPVAEVRRILGASACIGVSTHAPGEVEAARRDGADFAFVGTVYETPTHPGRRGGGPDSLRATARAGGPFPLVAIGGVSVERTQETLAAGAYGVAVIRGVWSERDPARAVRRYLEVLNARTEPERGTDE